MAHEHFQHGLKAALIGAAIGMCISAGTAWGQEYYNQEMVQAAQRQAFPSYAQSNKPGASMLRLRGVLIASDESGSITPASLGGKTDFDDAYAPELDFTYFFTTHLAMEVMATGSSHDVFATGTTSGNLSLGQVSTFMPTLMLQYHFMPIGEWKPYVGAGLNYTFFYNEKPGTGAINVDYKNDFGYVLQAGTDWALTEKWGMNFDVKKMFMGTKINVNTGAITAKADIDPWIIGVGVSYRY